MISGKLVGVQKAPKNQELAIPIVMIQTSSGQLNAFEGPVSKHAITRLA